MLSLRRPSPAAVDALLRDQQDQPFSYAEVGATDGATFPDHYRHVLNTVELGHGPEVFARAIEGLRRWQAHVRGGASVHPPDAGVEEGVVVVVALRLAAIHVAVACRVVYVADQLTRWGFAYGTLPHHLVEGEEAFLVERDGSGTVRFHVSAFLRPGGLATRALGPLIEPLDRRLVRRYLRGMQRHVADPAA